MRASSWSARKCACPRARSAWPVSTRWRSTCTPTSTWRSRSTSSLRNEPALRAGIETEAEASVFFCGFRGLRGCSKNRHCSGLGDPAMVRPRPAGLPVPPGLLYSDSLRETVQVPTAVKTLDQATAAAVEAMRTPPHSTEAEQAVLGGLMLDNSAWERVADRIREEDFYRQDHRLIFLAMTELADQDQPFDAVTLAEWLQARGKLEQAGGLAYLATLARDTPTAANVRAYADIVRERSVLRQLIRVGGV